MLSRIYTIQTALPPHMFSQDELHGIASAVLPDTEESKRILDVFKNAAIDQRYLAMPVEWYLEDHGHAERSQVFHDVGLSLIQDAAKKAMAAANLPPEALRGVIVVSTTGMATPSLDAKLIDSLGWPSSLRRLPVWGLGCAGGVAGLNRAAEWSEQLGGPVLVVCMELCSINLHLGEALTGGKIDKRAIVSTAIFGDGCAAAIVGPDGSGPSLLATSSHLFPETEWVMGWAMTDVNMEVVLSPKIPEIVEAHAEDLVRTFLSNQGVDAPDAWILHPGGARVIDAYQNALRLSNEDRKWTDAVLRTYGNMSSPTVLFCLRDYLDSDAAAPDQHLLLSALGPGFSSELALVRT